MLAFGGAGIVKQTLLRYQYIGILGMRAVLQALLGGYNLLKSAADMYCSRFSAGFVAPGYRLIERQVNLENPGTVFKTVYFSGIFLGH